MYCDMSLLSAVMRFSGFRQVARASDRGGSVYACLLLEYIYIYTCITIMMSHHISMYNYNNSYIPYIPMYVYTHIYIYIYIYVYTRLSTAYTSCAPPRQLLVANTPDPRSKTVFFVWV